jgi:two-component system, NtrC family, sensor kinase
LQKISDEDFILKIIRYVPVIFIIIISILTTAYISSTYIYNLENEKKQTEKEYIDFNKELIKTNINNISEYINNKHALTNEILKDQLKNQVYAAHNMMTSIYNEFKDTRTKEEITLIIKTALKNMKFSNDGRYYFVYDLDGIGIFHPTKPEREGINHLNEKDASGNFLIQEAIKIAKSENKEGYQTWMFDKPNEHKKEYEKLGFIKQFEPYNWFIGVGEYIEDFDNQIKQDIIEHIKEIGFKDTKYIFVIDKKADFLLTRTKYSNVSDIDKKNLFVKSYNDFINSKDEDKYIAYEFINNNNEYSEKISYIKKIKVYDWIIGTGFNSDNLNLKIKEKKQILEKQYHKYINLVLIISVVMTIFLLILSMFISRILEKRFLKYKEDLESQIVENLNQKETLLKAQEVARIGDWKLDLTTNKSVYSDEVIRIFGLNVKDKDKFGPEYLKSIMINEDKIFFDDLFNNCISTEKEQRCIYRVIRPSDNEIVWVESRGKLNKEKLYIIGTIQDITESKILELEKQQREELFYQQSKMAAMGEMIGNIAHQWRQPLSVISTASTGLKIQKEMNILTDADFFTTLTAINSSAQYLSDTIEDFRTFFNPSNNKINEFNISDTFSKTSNLLNAQFTAKDIEIIQNIEKHEIFSIENELIQVLINILNNSRDALLAIENQRRLVFINTYSKDNSLHIEIKDNAGGIKEEIIDRIFEPYFTTKHKAQGTGIGLYMSKEIIEKHLNGVLLVSNEKYNYENVDYVGARFVIEIGNLEVKS